MTSVATPEPMHPKRGAPTSLAWGTNEKDTCDFLVCGTVNGYLCIMKRVHGSVRDGSLITYKIGLTFRWCLEGIRRGLLRAA